MEVGDRIGNVQLMLSAFQKLKLKETAPHPTHLRRLLIRLANPKCSFGFRTEISDILAFVDAYIDLRSWKNMKSVFEALAISQIHPSLILNILQRCLRPGFDPEGKLGEFYPFPTTKHYRQYTVPEETPLDTPFVDDTWRLKALLSCGQSLRHHGHSFSKKIISATQWMEVAQSLKERMLQKGNGVLLILFHAVLRKLGFQSRR